MFMYLMMNIDRKLTNNCICTLSNFFEHLLLIKHFISLFHLITPNNIQEGANISILQMTKIIKKLNNFPNENFKPFLLNSIPIRVLWGFPGGSDGKESTCKVGETQVGSLGWEDSLEEGMTTHSSILTWRIPWTEDSDGHKESVTIATNTRVLWIESTRYCLCLHEANGNF